MRLEARPANAEGAGAVSVRELVRASLRMRPDRLVVGEVRGGEALDMLQACNTGHDGSLSTVHANCPADALARLETLVLLGGVALPLGRGPRQLGAAIDAIVQVARGARRRASVVAIAEVGRGAGADGAPVAPRETGGAVVGAVDTPTRPARRLGVDLGGGVERSCPPSPSR